jgi:hypothetical protein
MGLLFEEGTLQRLTKVNSLIFPVPFSTDEILKREFGWTA